MTDSAAEALAGQVALVSGGSRGIGRAVVLALARAGCEVVFCYQTQEAAAAQVCREAIGGGVTAVRADVHSHAEIERLVAETLARHRRIDILVNNAGHFPSRPAVEISDEEWDDVLQTNLTAVFAFCRAVAPGMIAAGGGVIVNIASVAGQRGSAFHAHYAAAKGGVLALTRSLAREWARQNVRVNAVSPGRIATDLLLERADEAERARWRADTPVGRLGTPEEVAAAVLFLASPAAAYIHGETIAVNGGLLMD